MDDDLQSQIDDLSDQLDNAEQDTQDLSDNTDSNFSDINDTLNQYSDNLDNLNQNSGQLTFPLSQDTIQLISEQAQPIIQYLFSSNYIGTTTLVAGIVAVATNLTTANSLILLSVSTPGGTQGNLSYAITPTGFTITSSSAMDTSTVIYFILTI